MGSLSRFFKENAKEISTVEYVASERFTDDDGKPLKWLLRPVSSREFDDISNKANKSKFGGKGKKDIRFDMAVFRSEFCAAAVVYPDLKNAELQQNYGVLGDARLLQEMLSVAGELNALYDKVNEISGFDKDMDELVDEAKN